MLILSDLAKPSTKRLLVLVLAATGTGAARGQDVAQPPPSAKDDIVVVGRKRPDPAAGIKPDDTLPDTLIKGFGADTISDVLARLRARYGSSEFSIVVNGRPVGSLVAIEALPPEALAKIDILPASAAGQLGVPGDARIINLQLRPRFRSTALEAEATRPSGGSPGQSMGVRHARIAGERRFNSAVSYQRTAPLRISDQDVAGDQRDDRALTPGSTLVPSSQAATATFGLAGPLGSGGYDLSLQGGLSDQKASIASAPATDGLPVTLVSQRDAQQSLRAGATLNGSIGKQAWTIAASAGAAWATTTGGLAGDPRGRLASRSTDQSATATVTGPLVNLPSGPVFATSTLNVFSSAITTRGSVLPTPSRTGYRTFAFRENLRLPLLKPGRVIGPLAVTFGSEVTHIANAGNTVTYNVGTDWQVATVLTLTAYHAFQPSLPSSNALFAPVIARQGIPFFDDRTGITSPITILSGGTTALRRSVTVNDSIRANVTAGAMTLAVDYAATRIEDPALSFGSPSALLERIVPGLFVRGADGTLQSYDSRPIVGVSETLRRASANLHLSGALERRSPRSGRASAGAGRLFWDMGVNYELLLSDAVQITRSTPPINVLQDPLNLSASAPSRHKVTVQASLSTSAAGLNLSGTWRSGSRESANGAATPRGSQVAPLFQIGGDMFVDLQRNTSDPDDPSALRLKLSISNVFNARPRLSGQSDRLYGLIADPRGRVVSASLRKTF